MTGLLFAARHGATHALTELIGAHSDARSGEGFSALVVALRIRHSDAAKLPIEAGAALGGGTLQMSSAPSAKCQA